MLDYKEAMNRKDPREYYALTQIPVDFVRILLENVQNFIVNHVEKIPELTIEDIIGTANIEALSLRALAYILILRYVGNVFV